METHSGYRPHHGVRASLPSSSPNLFVGPTSDVRANLGVSSNLCVSSKFIVKDLPLLGQIAGDVSGPNLLCSNRSMKKPNHRLKLTAPSVTPLAAYNFGGQASRPRPAA